jgi:hypothetical protein
VGSDSHGGDEGQSHCGRFLHYVQRIQLRAPPWRGRSRPPRRHCCRRLARQRSPHPSVGMIADAAGGIARATTQVKLN